eukprot:TRINITY_DN1983_c0_g2_i1.p1 TRINITY_DN1983_c0_g2~~TRINITY_DN1983_c0_g2_i1.p1  ORF type:complete len:982 (-),score=292.26 TRINITY_DN1983_c0_g2_i1:160-3105(-)
MDRGGSAARGRGRGRERGRGRMHRRVQTSTLVHAPSGSGGPSGIKTNLHKRENTSPSIDIGKHASPLAVMRLCKRKDIIEREETVKQLRGNVMDCQKDILKLSKECFSFEGLVREFEHKIVLLVKNVIGAESMKDILLRKPLKSVMQIAAENETPSEPKLLNEDLFGRLFYLFQQDGRFLARLSRRVSSVESNVLLQTIVFTLFGNQFNSTQERKLMSLFLIILQDEFDSCTNPGVFMRSNTVFTRMLSVFIKRSPYHDFLVEILEPIVSKIVVMREEINFEMNPSKIYAELVKKRQQSGGSIGSPSSASSRRPSKDVRSPSRRPSTSSSADGKTGFTGPTSLTVEEAMKRDDVKSILRSRSEAVGNEVRRIVNLVFSSVEDTPYALRLLCKKILEYGLNRFKDADESAICSLVGGFIFLRFFTPAIVSPVQYGVLSDALSEHQMRNLVAIAKVLQNLSNGVLFGEKESFMESMNSVLVELRPQFEQYVKKLADVEDLDVFVFRDRFLEPLERDPVCVDISMEEVFLIHSVCVKYKDAILAKPLRNETPVEIAYREEMKSIIDDLVHETKRMSLMRQHVDGSETMNLELLVPPSLVHLGQQELLEVEGQVSESVLLSRRNASKELLVQIFRRLPEVPHTEGSTSPHSSGAMLTSSGRQKSYTLSEILGAGKRMAVDKEDYLLAHSIQNAMQQLQELFDASSHSAMSRVLEGGHMGDDDLDDLEDVEDLDGMDDDGEPHSKGKSEEEEEDDGKGIGKDRPHQEKRVSLTKGKTGHIPIQPQPKLVPKSHPAGDIHGFYGCLLDELKAEIDNLDETIKFLEVKKKEIVFVLDEIKSRHSFLEQQYHVYKKYMENVRRKAYHTNGVGVPDGAERVMGPFFFKIRELERDGVVVTKLDDRKMHRMITVKMWSTQPSLINVSVRAGPLRLIDLELDLNDLLEKHFRGQETLVYEEVNMNIAALIQLINKLFVLGRPKVGNKKVKLP